jgi:hypothetical protein
MGEAPFRGAPFAGRGGIGGGFAGPAHNAAEYKQLFIGNVSWREADKGKRADLS